MNQLAKIPVEKRESHAGCIYVEDDQFRSLCTISSSASDWSRIHCCVIEKKEADGLCSIGLPQRGESREDCIGNFRSRNCPRDNSRPEFDPGHWCPACALPAKVHWLYTA